MDEENMITKVSFADSSSSDSSTTSLRSSNSNGSSHLPLHKSENSSDFELDLPLFTADVGEIDAAPLPLSSPGVEGVDSWTGMRRTVADIVASLCIWPGFGSGGWKYSVGVGPFRNVRGTGDVESFQKARVQQNVHGGRHTGKCLAIPPSKYILTFLIIAVATYRSILLLPITAQSGQSLLQNQLLGSNNSYMRIRKPAKRAPNFPGMEFYSQKVSVVLMNYSRPRMIKHSQLMKTLIDHPAVDEILLLHANPKTAFLYNHEKVVNIDATEENTNMGLALRFFHCQAAKNEWVIHVDDDMEFDKETLTEMIQEFGHDSKRIVGKFGRDRGRPNGLFAGYSTRKTTGVTDVVLTKLMILERDLCGHFFEYAPLVWEDTVMAQGIGPLWNGEDIFMSLVANHVYGAKRNYAMSWLDVRDAPDSLKDYRNGEKDISGGFEGYRFWSWPWWQSLLRRNRHYQYRGILWGVAEAKLENSR